MTVYRNMKVIWLRRHYEYVHKLYKRYSQMNSIMTLLKPLNNPNLLIPSQRVREGGQLSDEVRVTSGVTQGSVLGPLLFLAYVNDIWRIIESKIRLFADDCIVYRKIVNNYDVDKLQTDLDRLGDWAVENEMKINPCKSKSISFTRSRIKTPLITP